MNYASAESTLIHAGHGKKLPQRNMCNATRLVRSLDTEGGPDEFYIELFGKEILRWKKNGNMVITSAGYRTVSTQDRLRRYLPGNFRVWSQNPYWFISTPSGIRPFIDGMEMEPGGTIKGLPDFLNKVSATDLQRQVHEYAKKYSRELTGGRISEINSCNGSCSKNRLLQERESDTYLLHLFEHVQAGTCVRGIVDDALNYTRQRTRGFFHKLSRSQHDLARVVGVSWTEARQHLRRNLTEEELINDTELEMTTNQVPVRKIKPHLYVTNIRMLIEDYLLEVFRFEVV